MTKNSFYNYLKLTGHKISHFHYLILMQKVNKEGTAEYYQNYYINQLFPEPVDLPE